MGVGLALAVMLSASLAWAGDASEGEDIFDGETLDGWVVEGTDVVSMNGRDEPVWSVRDGCIVCRGAGLGFLRYDRELTDFRLTLQFRMGRDCNSGVSVRAAAYPSHLAFFGGRPSQTGYEVQILDDAGSKPTPFSSGALYRYAAPKENAVRAAGEWNELLVECLGPRIRVVLNGKTLHDFDQTSLPATREKPHKGYLSLQNHGRHVEFRDLRLDVTGP